MANSSSMVSYTQLSEFYTQLNRFRDIKFVEDTHEYFHGTKKMLSVTQWIKKKITPNFNTEYWLKYKTLKGMGLNVQKLPDGFILVNGDVQHYTEIKVDTSVLKKEWANTSTTALSKGNDTHKGFELTFQGMYINDLLWNYYQLNPHLVLIKSEFTVADYENGIVGRLDALFFNLNTSKIELHDIKTDKEIVYSNRFESLLPPLEFMSNCNFNKYTIQVNMYKHCIEKYTDLRIDVMKIIHITDKIEVIEIPDCPDIIKMLLR